MQLDSSSKHPISTSTGLALLFGSLLWLVACGTTSQEPPPRETVSLDTAHQDESAETDDLISVAALQQDFDHLYSTLAASHVNLYVHTPKEDYDAHFQTFRHQLDAPMSRFEAQVHFQRFMALGKIGHSRIEFPQEAYASFRAEGGKTAPFYFRVVDGRVWVTENYSTLDDLAPGAEILQLNGKAMAEWLPKLRRHISSETDAMAHGLLEFWFPRLLWLELGDVEAVTLTVRSDGSESPRSVQVPMRTQEEIQEAASQAAERLELDWTSRSARMLEGGVAYLRPGPFYEPTSEGGYDVDLFRQFINQSFEEFLAKDAHSLLIDLRDNPGGDNSFSDIMVAWFANRPFRFCSAFRIKVSDATTASNRARMAANPDLEDSASADFAALYDAHPAGSMVDFDMPYSQPRDGARFEGKVYLLINRHSFSNAVTVAALVQDYELGTVLGEATTDLATSYGAMEQFELPNSGIRVGYPKAHLVRPSGDQRLRGVTPDIAIETPLLQGPDDPVLQEALSVMERES